MAQRAEITLFKPYTNAGWVINMLTVKFCIWQFLEADAACRFLDELGLISIFITPF
jgi:hypothetical protein